jgi:hypothetical protein
MVALVATMTDDIRAHSRGCRRMAPLFLRGRCLSQESECDGVRRARQLPLTTTFAVRYAFGPAARLATTRRGIE